MYYFPFDRVFKVDSENISSITGQFITEKYTRSNVEGYDPNFDFDSANPQIFEPSYLMRYELEELSNSVHRYLIEERKRSYDQIIRAAQIIREELWRGWAVMVDMEEESSEYSPYNTGSNAKSNGPDSYRTWTIYSDPLINLEFVPDDWFNQDQWKGCDNWTWREVYAVLSIWCIDEAAVYLNSDRVFHAATWLLRAQEYFNWTHDYNSQLAKMGGKAKSEKYQPLRTLAVELAQRKAFKSRRNAVKNITPAILLKAKELQIPLSEQQAEITITGWLKEKGLPANI